MNNKVILESIAMDLKRVALGYNRGSFAMAKRFSEEALKRRQEIQLQEVKPYMKALLHVLSSMLENTDTQKVAEDALMMSTLLQNYTQTFF